MAASLSNFSASGTTARKEADRPEFIAGLVDGHTCGAPVTACIRNTNTRSSDYEVLRRVPRPGHADYTGHVRYGGYEDWRGGGHFSGRLTAPLVFAGALCRQYLAEQGVRIGAHIEALGGLTDRRFTPEDAGVFSALREMRLPVLTPGLDRDMAAAIREVKARGDSVGGVVECMTVGLPVGLGAPFFDSVESQLAHLLFSIPAVKGVEFGDGFGFGQLTGSEANDALRMREGKVTSLTNHSGGINGGITNGMPLIFRLCIRATPTIHLKQQTVSLQRMADAEIEAAGRHDPCILPRAVPVVEAAAAIVLLDLWKERAQNRP